MTVWMFFFLNDFECDCFETIFGDFLRKKIPFCRSFPWNQKTFFGYLGEVLLSSTIGNIYVFCNGTLILLFISVCLHHQAFYKRHRYLVNRLQYINHSWKNKETFHDLIQFHISVKG